ncbi:MAG: hypothetical protein HQ481_03985 [Alphaproteobacteria bacterium]|nr:hypothetical protein [Alphaproteobacteria bacterium]
MRLIRNVIAAALAMAALSAAAQAQESMARSWGLVGEEKARFEAKVVDLPCAITGNCPADCGAGTRPLGLLRDDGSLVVAAKNTQAIFSGAVEDLIAFCGKRVEVDGLMVGEGTPRIYQVQLVRDVEAGGDFQKTTLWSRVWNERYPELKAKKGPWFRKDPRVNALIARDGYLGLGLEVDKKFIAEW